jgi:uncharacterized protein (TIGR02646 family)
MIIKIDKNYTLTALQEARLALFPGASSINAWNSQANIIKEIKESIRSQLLLIQKNKCCYCGLQLWQTSANEIEHIAPKASRIKAYPEFAFTKMNLALACELCNGIHRKWETDTIWIYNAQYNFCTFKLVHPYLDNPDNHYGWVYNSTKVVMSHKTLKGQYSISLFGLNEIPRIEARASQRNYEKTKRKYGLRQNALNKIKAIVNFYK